MRTTLLPGILDVVRRNLHHRNVDLRLFEIGRVFMPRPGEALPLEPRRLGGAMLGGRLPEHWGAEPASMDLFDLKGILEAVVETMDIPNTRFEADASVAFLQPHASLWVRSGEERLGWLGELRSSVAEAWELDGAVYVFEMDFERMAQLGRLERRYRPLPRFPEVVRDLSVLVDKGVPAGRILDEICGGKYSWLQRAYLYDVFQEEKKIPEGMKSLTFRIRYRSTERNLTDEEVNEQQKRLIGHLQDTFGARLRPN